MILSQLQKEALSVMAQGGRQLCQRAKSSWYGNQYGTDETQRKEMLNHWKEVESEIRALRERILTEDTDYWPCRHCGGTHPIGDNPCHDILETPPAREAAK